MMKVKSGEYVSEGSSLTHSLTDFLYVRKTRSTMIIARSVMKRSEKLAIIAGYQTSGIGRRGRTWASPPGGLWFSLVLKTCIPASVVPFLSLAMSLSVVEVLRLKGLNAWIKWPNDIVVDGKKISGVLVDVKIDSDDVVHAIIGVGINVNFYLRDLPADLQDSVVTILEVLGYKLDILELLDEILREFDKYIAILERRKEQVIIEKVEEMLYGKGQKVVAICETGKFSGILKGIGQTGSLVLETENGIKEIDSFSLEKLLIESSK